LAIRLLRGDGLPRDPAEGIKWFRIAAENGDPAAQNDLGYSLESELNEKADLIEVCKWYLLASRKGIRQADVNLAKLKRRLTPAQFEEAGQRAEAFTPKQILQVDPIKSMSP
jgi:TPR repeat protein